MSERDLDQLLDSALPSYLAEPPVGLEHRVLRRARRFRIWPSAIGLAAAAAIAVAYFLPAADPVAPPPLVAVHAPRAPIVQVAAPPPAPKPRPVHLPMTRRERVLLQFAQSNPELVQQILVDAPKQMALDLSIEPLVVEPLNTGGE